MRGDDDNNMMRRQRGRGREEKAQEMSTTYVSWAIVNLFFLYISFSSNQIEFQGLG